MLGAGILSPFQFLFHGAGGQDTRRQETRWGRGRTRCVSGAVVGSMGGHVAGVRD